MATELRKLIARVSLASLLKAVMLLVTGPIVVLLTLLAMDELDPHYFIYGTVGIILSTAILALPYLANINALTNYVDDLAGDRRVDAPDLSFIGEFGQLSKAVKRLHHSWDRRKQQMESMISEREILVDTIPDLLVMIDSDLNIVRTNSAARLRFGQNLANRPLEEIIEDERLIKVVGEVMGDFRGRDIEFYVPEPVSSYFRAKIERFPVHSKGGIAAILTLHDITELKRTEQMRADFVANASHEIRTPLASLIGFIETLQGPAKDDQKAMEQFLKIMSEQATRMSKLVNDLLSLSKIEMSVNAQPQGKVDVRPIFDAIKKNTEWQAGQRNVMVESFVEENLPLIQGEENELLQVFQNLTENSIKYGNADSVIKVSAKLTDHFPKDKNFQGLRKVIAVSVQDQSEGIPKEHLSRLTERFYRVDTARSRKIGGTGLGLAIVKHIINRHKGVITIDSELGVGSTFTVFLPIYEQQHK